MSFLLSLIVNYLLVLIKTELHIFYNSIWCLDYEAQKEFDLISKSLKENVVCCVAGCSEVQKKLLVLIIILEAWGQYISGAPSGIRITLNASDCEPVRWISVRPEGLVNLKRVKTIWKILVMCPLIVVILILIILSLDIAFSTVIQSY